jgi:hypothetical protein
MLVIAPVLLIIILELPKQSQPDFGIRPSLRFPNPLEIMVSG